MDKGEIQKKIKEAKEFVGGEANDPFIQIAFREVFRMLLRQSSQPAVSQNSRPVASVAQDMQLSEFLAQMKKKRETDKVDAILSYNLHNGEESSTREEILEAYAKAKLGRPTNLSDVIARCIRKGHLIESAQTKDGKKAWRITATGERYVEEQLAP